MPVEKVNKQSELDKIRDIVIASIEYYIDEYNRLEDNKDFTPIVQEFKNLIKRSNEQYNKGQLTKLKQTLRYISEWPRDTFDTNYVRYIKEKTGHDYNIFDLFEKRIRKIISNGVIETENQYNDVLSKIDDLCQSNPSDETKINILDNLLSNYENSLKNK